MKAYSKVALALALATAPAWIEENRGIKFGEISGLSSYSSTIPSQVEAILIKAQLFEIPYSPYWFC